MDHSVYHCCECRCGPCRVGWGLFCNCQHLFLSPWLRSLTPFDPMSSHTSSDLWFQRGRIGIVGGSLDYTGAPYYAAQSSLYFGADLATIFCSADALIPIKTYSPELMVTPLYDATEIELLEDNQIATQLVTKLKPYLLRLHALVVGPGLGRHPKLLPNLAPSIRLATETHLPYVGTSDSEISPSIDWCLMPWQPQVSYLPTPDSHTGQMCTHSQHQRISDACEPCHLRDQLLPPHRPHVLL
jgi:hypothetical protein